MKVLVIGGGGRESAMLSKLSQSPLVTKLFSNSLNADAAGIDKVSLTPASSPDELLRFALENEVDLTAVGPEGPLVEGVADLFRENGLAVFGPGREGARLEGSKSFAKEFMLRHGINTAAGALLDSPEAVREHLARADFPVVIKADGLAGGKGVAVCADRGEAEEFAAKIMEEKAFGPACDTLVAEEFLEGEEISLMTVISGGEYRMFPPAQDHKPLLDGDLGPNTGGMGCYAPTPHLMGYLPEIEAKVVRPCVQGLIDEGFDYRGVLYVSLMVSPKRIDVIEFNVRFGDPEAQILLPNLDQDLADLMLKTATGNLAQFPKLTLGRSGVCVVLSSGGYPGAHETGFPVEGLGECANFAENGCVFHCGTRASEGRVLTAGGRVFCCCGYDGDLKTARDKAYALAAKISFKGCHYRKDIADKALK